MWADDARASVKAVVERRIVETGCMATAVVRKHRPTRTELQPRKSTGFVASPCEFHHLGTLTTYKGQAGPGFHVTSGLPKGRRSLSLSCSIRFG